MYECEKFEGNKEYLEFKSWLDEENEKLKEIYIAGESFWDSVEGAEDFREQLISLRFGSYENAVLEQLKFSRVLYSCDGLERSIEKNKDLPTDELIIGLSEQFRKHDDFLMAEDLRSIIKKEKPELLIYDFSLAAYFYFSNRGFARKKAIFYTPIYNEITDKTELSTLAGCLLIDF